MTEFHVADAWLRRVDAAVTIIVCAAVVGLAYRYERAYRRWAEQQHPLAASRARLERARTSYQDRRALATELARIIRGSTDAGRPPVRTGS